MPILPKRKHPRLKEYDYDNGAYFVTICSYKKTNIFSRIAVGRGLAPAEIKLTEYGIIAEQEIDRLNNRYPSVSIDKYVIMPNHIHMILIIEGAAGASPRPTVMDVICAFKSLTSRRCKKTGKIERVFQTSFYDHVIRNRNDYLGISEYIEHNPAKWAEDEYYG